MDVFVAGLILGAFLYICVVGIYKCFVRNWLAALLLLLFAFPFLFIWALVECFTGPVKQRVQYVKVIEDELDN